MKKVLLTAAVAMFAMSANAQNETQRTSDAHNILVNLAVTDMIDLDPEAQTGNGALNSWAAYNPVKDRCWEEITVIICVEVCRADIHPVLT